MKSFIEFLVEVFDKPWTKEHDPEMTKRVVDSIAAKKEPNDTYANVKAHKLEGDNGHLISFVRNGALEAHHIDKNESSHGITGKSKPNPRFYSTMIEHLKTQALDKGRSARITSLRDSPLSKHYDSIATKLAKKHGYPIDKKTDRGMGKDLDVIEIHPKGYTRNLEELLNKIIL